MQTLSTPNILGAHISVHACVGAIFSHINIHAPAHSPNTDRFDISGSKNILIEDSNIGTGDDCIAINGGTSDINATRVACGPGHRIRGSGYARKITFEEIILVKAQNPIIIDQYYGILDAVDGAVEVTDVTYRGFRGTSADALAINLKCYPSGCSNIVFDQNNIVSSQPGKKTYAFCKNVHATVKFTIPNIDLSRHFPTLKQASQPNMYSLELCDKRKGIVTELMLKLAAHNLSIVPVERVSPDLVFDYSVAKALDREEKLNEWQRKQFLVEVSGDKSQKTCSTKFEWLNRNGADKIHINVQNTTTKSKRKERVIIFTKAKPPASLKTSFSGKMYPSD
ncbi:hypothetical protein VNO77_09194 [Canavalia gladiata]|uniref:Uncharacterized protein n=1 Tax=Canavalia gladiata TaxID=3824 RepID=A0AAN9M909_CANGL